MSFRHRTLILLAASVVVASAVSGASASRQLLTPAPFSPGRFPLLPQAPAPWRPGDHVWTSEPPPSQAVAPLSNGCQRVPANGYIGPGVYASSGAQYSVFWSWSASSDRQPFHWYIYATSGVLKADGSSNGGGGSQSVTANNHYWKVQNQGSIAQAWTVCWND